MQIKKGEINNKQYNNNTTTIIVNTNSNNNNTSISPILSKNRKISNIPTSKNKSQNLNNFTYEGNYKKGNKLDHSYVNNRKK